MKKRIQISVLLLLTIILTNSCGIEKRKHLRGFYIPNRSSIKASKIDKTSTNDSSFILTSNKEMKIELKEKTAFSSVTKKEVNKAKSIDSIPKNDTTNHVNVPSSSLLQERLETISGQHKNYDFSTTEDKTGKELHPLAQRSELFAAVSFLLLFIGIGLIGMIFAIIYANRSKKLIASEPDKYYGRKKANGVLWFCFIILALLALAILLLTTGALSLGISISIF